MYSGPKYASSGKLAQAQVIDRVCGLASPAHSIAWNPQLRQSRSRLATGSSHVDGVHGEPAYRVESASSPSGRRAESAEGQNVLESLNSKCHPAPMGARRVYRAIDAHTTQHR